MPQRNSCKHRRLAMQLAVQLPDNLSDARLVLRLCNELVDDFFACEKEERSEVRRLRVVPGEGEESA